MQAKVIDHLVGAGEERQTDIDPDDLGRYVMRGGLELVAVRQASSEVPAWRACSRSFSAKRRTQSQKAILFGIFGQLMPVGLPADMRGAIAPARATPDSSRFL